MSITDQAQTADSDWHWRTRWAVYSLGDLLALLSGGTRSTARTLWGNRPLRVAIIWGIAAWIILELIFVAWVHRELEGESFRAFLPGLKFGQTEAELAAGLAPISLEGYDGQMYYRVSNDLLGRGDAFRHMDAFLYRYQRIGVPMIAGGVAALLGYEVTPPLLYHTVQFGITAAGFAALVYWLSRSGMNPAYALGWLLSGGTLLALWQGLLDAPADAFFVFSFLAMWSGRILWYVPLVSLLLLTREGYVVYPFAVFVMTVLNRVEWRDVQGYWKRVGLLMLPGTLLVSWTIYLALHFHASTLKHFSANPQATGWPFAGMVHCIKEFYRSGNWFELRLAIVSGLTIVLVSLLFVRNLRRLPLALACALPYVLLTVCFGRMVWEAMGGFMKANGTIIIIGLLMASFDRSLLLRFMLILQAVVGVDLQAQTRMVSSRILSPYLVHEERGYPHNPEGSPENEVLNDLRSSVQWVRPETACRRKYHGIWDPFHVELKPVEVAITNYSDVTWQPGMGKHPIWIGYVLYDESGKRQLCDRSVILDVPLAPGQTHKVTTYLELRQPRQKYVVEFSLHQDGPGWFVKTDADLGRRYEFTVE